MRAPPTTYRQALTADDAGSYTLTVSDSADDYADDSTTTGTVVVGGSATGSIETLRRPRLVCGRPWRRASSIGSTWRDRSTGDGTLGAPYLRGIYDANGDQHEGTTDYIGGEGYNSRVYFRPDEDGTYYVSAGGHPDTSGTYTLAVSDARTTTRTSYADGLRHDRDVLWWAARPRARSEYPGDQRLVRSRAGGGAAYQFDLQEPPSGGTHVARPGLRGIYDAATALI